MKNITLFIIGFSMIAKSSKVQYSETCTLMKATPVNPFPNLKKCYKYNNAACCNIIHDLQIEEWTNKYLIAPCLRKYPEFEELLCLACHPFESHYYVPGVGGASGSLFVCEDYAKKIWNGILTEPSRIFDNCGLKIPDDAGSDLKNYAPGKSYILPSVFPNFERFINLIGIPLYENVEIKIIQGDNKTCFTIKGSYISISLIVSLLISGSFLL